MLTLASEALFGATAISSFRLLVQHVAPFLLSKQGTPHGNHDGLFCKLMWPSSEGNKKQQTYNV